MRLILRRSSENEISIESASPDDRRLAILLNDYQMARDDERTFTNVQAAFFGLAVALLAGLATVLTNACQFQPAKVMAARAAHQVPECNALPNIMLALTPLVPLAVVGFMQLHGAVATVRSYYLRAIEEELRDYAGSQLKAIPAMPPASYVEFTTILTSLRRGGRGYRAITALVVIATAASFGGFVIYISNALPAPYPVIMITIYGAIALLIVEENLRVTVGGRNFIVSLLSRQAYYAQRGEWPNLPRPLLPSPPRERTLISYLLLPRPEDWVKWLFFPIAFTLAVLTVARVDEAQLGEAIIFFVVLEYLLYEARYQWNDIRGFPSDQHHPFRSERRRLPGPEQLIKIHVAWSGVFIALRLIAVLFLAVLLPSLHQEVLVAFVLVFFPAVLYELLRSARRENSNPDASGRTNDVQDPFPLSANTIAIWGIVGIGYAVRGLLGLYFGLNHMLPLATILLSGLMLWSFGVMVVTLTWALEAMAYCQTAGAQLRYMPYLHRKSHLGALLRYVDERRPVLGQDIDRPTGGVERVLASRGRVLAPWNLALWLSASSAAALGAVLSYQLAPPLSAIVVFAGIGLFGGLLLAGCGNTLQRWSLTVVGALVIFALAKYGGAPLPFLAFIPWTLCAGFYCGFRQVSYADLKAGLKPIVDFAAAVGVLLTRLAVGTSTWESIRGRSEGK